MLLSTRNVNPDTFWEIILKRGVDAGVPEP
jgi:hypothetical protein